MAEYIERVAAMETILGLTIVDSAVAQYANAVCSVLQDLPAADVAEVRHGRWIVHFDHFAPYQKCSVCGFEIPLVATENEGGMCLYKHCPECTACMDKEDEHES
jgi:hypothetical protein